MGKKKNKGNSNGYYCKICNNSPAYYVKTAGTYLCHKHTIPWVKKFIYMAAMAAGAYLIYTTFLI